MRDADIDQHGLLARSGASGYDRSLETFKWIGGTHRAGVDVRDLCIHHGALRQQAIRSLMKAADADASRHELTDGDFMHHERYARDDR